MYIIRVSILYTRFNIKSTLFAFTLHRYADSSFSCPLFNAMACHVWLWVENHGSQDGMLSQHRFHQPSVQGYNLTQNGTAKSAVRYFVHCPPRLSGKKNWGTGWYPSSLLLSNLHGEPACYRGQRMYMAALVPVRLSWPGLIHSAMGACSVGRIGEPLVVRTDC